MLSPGTNTVAVKGVDWAGNNSAVVPRTIYLGVPVPLNIVINGTGSTQGKPSSIGTPVRGHVGREPQLHDHGHSGGE